MSDRRHIFSHEKTSSLSSQEDFGNSLCPNPNESDVSDVEKSYLKISQSAQSKIFLNAVIKFSN